MTWLFYLPSDRGTVLFAQVFTEAACDLLVAAFRAGMCLPYLGVAE